MPLLIFLPFVFGIGNKKIDKQTLSFSADCSYQFYFRNVNADKQLLNINILPFFYFELLNLNDVQSFHHAVF